jgi:peptide-methionine (R)-S-oxide reductase
MAALKPVMVFSKSWCPFCDKAKQALKDSGVDYALLELDNLGEQTEGQIQDCLATITGARTVPQVFVGGKCIGGGTDTVALAASGELQKLVESANAKYKEALKGQGTFKTEKSDEDWQSELDPQAFRILRRRGTEPPGSHPYDKMLPEKGHFGCAGCGTPLYSASSKFASNCGWPVFKQVYESPELGQHVIGRPDGTGSLEIVCANCGSHLGHVFYDAVSESNPNGERH